MYHILFEESPTYPIALLVKPSALREKDLLSAYVEPLVKLGVPKPEIIAYSMDYAPGGKAPVSLIKGWIESNLQSLKEVGTKYLYVTDSAYFKALTKQSKAEPHMGYVLPCAIKGFEDINVVLGVNYQALMYKPELQEKVDLSLKTLADHSNGTYQAIGSGIIHAAEYPRTNQEIAMALNKLHAYPKLAADIEAFSLRFYEAGVGTIGFAPSQHSGVAFACDYKPSAQPVDGLYGIAEANPTVRLMIREFLENYQGEITWHNSSYDLKVLIYTLWMKDPLDTAGLLKGLKVLTRNFQDSKIIAYLALNSTARNSYSLKDLAHEFAGNWAQAEIKDIRKIPLPELLQYNLIDCLSTNYVKDKYEPRMIQDDQEDIYRNLMLPSLKTIIQMELTGMPMNMATIKAKKAEMEAEEARCRKIIDNHPLVQEVNYFLQEKAMLAKQATLKKKVVTIADFVDLKFNPGSPLQMQELLYNFMALPVVDLTDTKQPATGDDTIKKLLNHTSNESYKDLLGAIRNWGKVTKVLGTFIPAFEKAHQKGDGWFYLHGSFNLGGTVSGRLSSSDPNLQNIPAGSVYGKAIKECFEAPQGWLFCGADFASLEDRISALTTKDPNKLKVYTDGYDGHCLRAFSYFGEEMVGIDPSSVESINSIEHLYKALRQDSKAPTFALTYQGTWKTLVNNCGFSEEKAKLVEKRYHDLYKVSDDYVQGKLKQACDDGYITAAFGLRVRTPLLGQIIWDSGVIPYEAMAEGRTAGNALGQSYCLLNNRAANAFMEAVWASEYSLDIKPVAMIHDAIYILVRDDPKVMEFANRELTKAMQWQELPEIQHPEVTLGGALDIFWPTWAKAVTLDEKADEAEIIRVCSEHKQKILNP